MEWYHFSDFHIGRPKGPQSSALASLIDAVKAVCDEEASKVDAVFITGDIAYSGQAEEYRVCKEFCVNGILGQYSGNRSSNMMWS